MRVSIDIPTDNFKNEFDQKNIKYDGSIALQKIDIALNKISEIQSDINENKINEANSNISQQIEKI